MCVRFLIAAAVSVGLLLAAGAQEAVRPARYQPRDWLAFVSNHGGFVAPLAATVNATPDVIVFRDGRIVWHEEGFGPRRLVDAETWRQGRVTQSDLTALVRLTEQNEFFTLRPEPPSIKRQQISDLHVTTVGVNDEQRRRVVDAYALDFYGAMPVADALTRSTVEVANAIYRLRPKQSRVFEPKVIRLGLGGTTRTETAPDWPLGKSPDLLKNTWGPFNYYAGKDARALIAAARDSGLLRLNDKVYEAAWAPAISIPEPTVSVGPIPVAIDKPEKPSRPRKSPPVVAPIRTFAGHSDYIAALAWSPDSKRLASATQVAEDQPRIWSIDTGGLERAVPGRTIYRLSWFPDGRLAVGAGAEICIWSGGGDYASALEHNEWWANALSISPDGKRLATGTYTHVWDVPSGKIAWGGRDRQIGRDLAWSPDGRSLATTESRGVVRLLDATNGSERRILHPAAHREQFWLHRPVAWRPDSAQLAAVDLDGSVVRVWDAATGIEAAAITYAGPALNSLSWSADGKWMTASSGTSLWLFDLASRRARRIRHPTSLYAAAWSPDGRWIAAGTSQGSVLVWEASALLSSTAPASSR